MILVTKKNKEKTKFLLNHTKIERIHPSYDTIIELENGKKIIVDETPEEIANRIIDFYSEVLFRSENKRM